MVDLLNYYVIIETYAISIQLQGQVQDIHIRAQPELNILNN